ncbi:MAG: hypothetical protein FRX49_00144 [Trebouxia sp. A1-2]|nr:MAG: hypothetical protein FRX49_00144 [Trebouxia sp. A1-2]
MPAQEHNSTCPQALSPAISSFEQAYQGGRIAGLLTSGAAQQQTGRGASVAAPRVLANLELVAALSAASRFKNFVKSLSLMAKGMKNQLMIAPGISPERQKEVCQLAPGGEQGPTSCQLGVGIPGCIGMYPYLPTPARLRCISLLPRNPSWPLCTAW